MFITSLLGRLMLAQKFMILSVIALVLACIPATLYINEADKNLNEAIMEQQGIRPLADLHKLIQQIQQHRGLSAMTLSGIVAERQERMEKQKEVDASFEVVARDMHSISDKTIQQLWSATRADWDMLRAQVAGGSIAPRQSNQVHADVIARLLETNDLIGDYYGLSLDPDMDTYQLIQYMYYQLPYLTEESGQMRAKGAALLAQHDISVEDRVLMSAVSGRVHDRFELVLKSYDKAASANPQFGNLLARGMQTMSKMVSDAIDLTNDKIVKGGTTAFAPADYVAFFTQAINSQFESDAEAGAVLNDALGKKIAAMERTRHFMLGAMAFLIVLAGSIQYAIARSVSGPTQRAVSLARALTVGVAEKLEAVQAIASGNLDHDVTPIPLPEIDPGSITRDEMGTLLTSILHMGEMQSALDSSFQTMTQALRHNREAERASDWLKSGLNELNSVMRGEHEVGDMADRVLNYLAKRLGAGVGALYLYDADALYLYGADERKLSLVAGYALTPGGEETQRIALGQGLAGQAGRDKKTLVLSEVPDGYLPIGSGMGQASPRNIIAIPLIYADSLAGVIELGSFHPFTALEMDFLEHVKEGVAIGFGVNQSRHRLQTLLAQTEQQTEELRVQQEELQQSNEELEERAEMLETQREQIRTKNEEVEAASQEIQRKVAELERVSSYKSEFLANMSHELRTPLNSMLILSSLLQKNKEGLLTPKQVEYATTIHGAGKDLLNLINDILDLSKIEAGRLEFHFEDVQIEHMVGELTGLFKPIADDRHLEFQVTLEEGVPPVLRADAQRLQQIVKNLLSNAFKFTAQGRVALSIGPAGTKNPLPLPVPALALAVRDSGIGIPADKHEQIFHAFQQADGSTSRKYGGTGLGLSISRQLAQRMGGEITLDSTPGQGSVFTLYLPQDGSQAQAQAALHAQPAASAIATAAHGVSTSASAMAPLGAPASAPSPAHKTAPHAAVAPGVANGMANGLLPGAVEDDRDNLRPGEHAILVVEDDLAFAGILRDTVRDHRFKVLVATDGETGLIMAERYAPEAIILDVMLPHIDGWGVMRSIKDNPKTRHIPVHFITCLEDRQKAMSMGAIGFVSKPVDPEQLDEIFKAIGVAIDKTARKLLVVEDDEVQANSIAELLDMGGLEIVIARTGHEALQRLQQEKFDCMVLDLGLADMSGYELLDALQKMTDGRRLPVIVHSGRNLSEADERKLKAYTDNIIVKGAQSPERLLNEVSLFLHLVESSLPQEKQKMIRQALDKEALLEQRKVLVVDDDIRNIFSLSSVLGDKGMHIVEAGNGREALTALDEHPDIDIVLMDVMMPEMDGYEAMRRIRKNPRHSNLPVIALTAKAMVGDQQLCLDAGANDYITKPVDVDKLFSLMRVWLYQAAQNRPAAS